ncbi:hypothetical protein JTB14_010872 [Gonioctena quinquepunctata]|nr:hypothetical protein JTB14_010872 [Gonioctena quinquepunctata]
MVEDEFLLPEKPIRERRKEWKIPEIPLGNTFSTSANMETDDQDEQIATNIVKTPEKKMRPPPIVIRDKKQWPSIRVSLRNQGIQSTNTNLRDEIKMVFPSMENYNKCLNILGGNKIQFHTFNANESKEIRAIFKSVVKTLAEDDIAKELQEKGYHLRIVARFKNRNKDQMPIILVIVPADEDRIKQEKTIYNADVEFELQRKWNSIGQCYNFQKFGHTAYNCNAVSVCRHCVGGHESRDHNEEDARPNKCSNCSGPHKANYHGCPNFPKPDKKEATRPVRPTRPPRERLQPPLNSGNTPLDDMLSALDELRDLISRRPILAQLLQLKNGQGAVNQMQD